jgi:hypothetical protein
MSLTVLATFILNKIGSAANNSLALTGLTQNSADALVPKRVSPNTADASAKHSRRLSSKRVSF